MNSKKAQGMPINVVVIAAIALIILLVLIGIFTGKIKWFGRGLATCPGDCTTEVICEKELGGYNLGDQYLVPERQFPSSQGELCGTARGICCSARKPT